MSEQSPSQQGDMMTADAFLPDGTNPLITDLDDMPGGTTASVPRLDRAISHAVSTNSQSYLLAADIIHTADRADTLAAQGDEEDARRERGYVIGMLCAYNRLVRVVLDSDSNPRLKHAYDGAVADVRADLEESKAFWGPLLREELPALERYHRLTKVQQQRPDVPGLADLRAAALDEAYRTGTDRAESPWTYRTLATETGMSVGRVQQLIARANRT
jgi:hypothetical protein